MHMTQNKIKFLLLGPFVSVKITKLHEKYCKMSFISVTQKLNVCKYPIFKQNL